MSDNIVGPHTEKTKTYLYLPKGILCLGCEYLEMMNSESGCCTLDEPPYCRKEYPRCYGYILENKEYQIQVNRVPVTECKNCVLLQQCIAEYNERVYHPYSLDEDEPFNNEAPYFIVGDLDDL